MLTAITKREKMLATLTVSITVIALIYNFIIEPLAKRWNSLDEEIREKAGLLRKHNRMLRNKEMIEELHSEYTPYFQPEALTPEEDSAIALTSIEKLARKAGVRITNIKPLAVKGLESYNKYTFRVATESTIGELTRFIYDLQSSGQLLKAERMVLRAKEREHTTIKAILNITKLSVF